MIFSRMAAGVCQSMRRSTRKPRLNHDASRCIRSRSTARERRIAGAQQVAAHGDDLGGGAGRQVEAAEELLARALHRPLQRRDGRRVGARQIGLGGAPPAPRRRAAWWRGSRGRRGAPRRRARDSARGSRWRWRRPRPRRGPTAARRPARDVVLGPASRRASAAAAGGPARRRCPAAPAGKKRSRECSRTPRSCAAGPSRPSCRSNYNEFATRLAPRLVGSQRAHPMPARRLPSVTGAFRRPF